jgi:hypothetical protein
MTGFTLFATSAAAGGFFLALVIALAVLVLAFEVWMFIDAMTNQALTTTTRFLWLFGMLLLHPIVAIAYYFTDRKKRPPVVTPVAPA